MLYMSIIIVGDVTESIQTRATLRGAASPNALEHGAAANIMLKSMFSLSTCRYTRKTSTHASLCLPGEKKSEQRKRQTWNANAAQNKFLTCKQ